MTVNALWDQVLLPLKLAMVAKNEDLVSHTASQVVIYFYDFKRDMYNENPSSLPFFSKALDMTSRPSKYDATGGTTTESNTIFDSQKCGWPPR